MIARRIACALTAALSLLFFASGCEPVEPPLQPEPEPKPKPKPNPNEVEPPALPDDAFEFTKISTTFDQAVYCDQMVNRNAIVREIDMVDGTITWRCGDVEGIEGEQRGLEYCEYMAVSGGSRIDSISQLGEEPLYCFFTAVFNDTFGKDQLLAEALAAPENFGVPTDPGIVRMQKVGFNARSAADGLINFCSTFPETLDQVRQAACAQASIAAEAAGDSARAQQLRDACRGRDLSNNATFAAAEALGARVLTEGEPGFQQQREIIGCIVSNTFLNADTTICGRTFRAGTECGCDWSPVPNALDGFLFGEWITPTNPGTPPECRLAKVDGQDYPHLMLCEVPEAEVAALRTDPDFAIFSNNLQKFCDARFGQKLAIQAPLRAIEIEGSCSAETEFCAAFTNANGQ